MRGLRVMARPIATRCRCPPESAFGLRSSRCSICRILAEARTRLSTSSFSAFASFMPKAMFSYTLMCG